MASNYTAHYGLCQWSPEDKFVREEFNGDNQAIETAIRGVKTEAAQALAQVAAAKCEVVFGTYTGDGAASQLISLGFVPKAVLTISETGSTAFVAGTFACYGGLALPGAPVWWNNGPVMEISGKGFRAYCDGSHRYANLKGQKIHYIAFK